MHIVDPEIATGEAAQLFTATHHALGVIPNLAKVMANNLAVLKGYLGVVGILGAEGTLSADVLERIALLVAQENESDYCLSVHSFRGTKVAGLTVVEVPPSAWTPLTIGPRSMKGRLSGGTSVEVRR
ncbi:hypothetical protein ACQP1V_26755 [Microtetraspora malaysiensis]|uniref:hypothetical protein n=1 Tax=Microtetraspora malaysiensis TaxID=161358 RepID=UPI003D8C783F